MKALISVSDKTGIVDLAQCLNRHGIEIISTGGTLKAISEAGIPATPIDEVTGFPEMLDGRVKTLHPKIHGGLLALRANDTHMSTCKEHQIDMIDYVIVNLYPFEETISKPDVQLEDAIENIDIGGPSMVRSASKNYQSVSVIVNPERYADVISELDQSGGKTSLETRQRLAAEAFEHTAQYDTMIADYLGNEFGTRSELPQVLAPKYTKLSDLRYGENPHQKAALYQNGSKSGLAGITQLHGKELSFNNLLDVDAAWSLVNEFADPAAVIIKHTNPCGVAIGADHAEAYIKAHAADPVSAFGSIVGINGTVTKEIAEEISKTFVEAVAALSFDKDALDVLTQKPSIRLLEIPALQPKTSDTMVKHIQGGLLVQSQDVVDADKSKFDVVTSRKPSDTESIDLAFGMKVVKHVKSNAIVIAKDGVAVGVGAGQMSRVEAAEIAIKRAQDKVNGAVVASDAFFPFRDSIEHFAKAGVTAVIQPGGSKRDQESIECCDENDMTMVFTGVRHFKH